MIKTYLKYVVALCVSTILGTTLKDVSYSIKQNGIMINLDYSDPIKDDDIIGWKSDRGWVYLTLLGVRAPKNKIPQQDFSGSVRKIVIDDFDESTQLAILVNKPVLGYDIINSKTSPSTVIFIHTEMKKSEVANLKKHIDEQGVSVFNVAQTSGFPKYNTNFKSAFDQARKELGPNSIFEYHGKLYTTNHPGEKDSDSNSLLIEKANRLIEKEALENYTIENKKSIIVKESYVEKQSGEILIESINDSVSINSLMADNTSQLLQKDKKLISKVVDSKNLDVNQRTKSEDRIPNSLNLNKEITSFEQKKQEIKIKKGFRFFLDKLFKKEKPGENVKTDQFVENSNFKSKSEPDINYVELQRKYIPDKIADVQIPEKDSLIVNFSATQPSDTNIVEPWFHEKTVEDLSTRYVELQRKYIPDQIAEVQIPEKDSLMLLLSATEPSDTNFVKPWLLEKKIEDFSNRNVEFQRKYIPDQIDNIQIFQKDSMMYKFSATEPSDTNFVKPWLLEKTIEDFSNRNVEFQKKYIPRLSNTLLDTSDIQIIYESSTQLPDTNTIEAWFKDDSFISDEFDATRLQKKHIPRYSDNVVLDTTRSTLFSHVKTQQPDTNIVEAWFKDDSFISDEFDATQLQKKHIPYRKNNSTFNTIESSDYLTSLPQRPEFTDPDVLDNRFQTRYKNDRVQNEKKLIAEKIIKKEEQPNTWLSFFPFQHDSVKKSLTWEFRREQEVPDFLQTERESLNYSSNENERYNWKEHLPYDHPKSFPKRKVDPGFMYYNNSGIRVDANIDGVPIYIDGKYIGETPLRNPVQVEPGWHQVSGFSPVYTQLASQRGLQYVGYDPIIENNKLYGATTVYAASGKLEIVELKFNQMGDTPKKLKEIEGGMNIGIPMILFILGFVTWGMG